MTAVGRSAGLPRFGLRSPKALLVSVRSSRRRITGGWGTGQIAIVVIVATLNMIGLAMVLSASSVSALYEGQGTWYHFTRQAIWLGLGLVALVITRAVDYRYWRRLIPLMLVATIGLLLLVRVPGVGITANGSTRWIGVAGFTVQPSELLKLVVILYTADLLAKRSHRLDDWVHTLVPALLVFGAGAFLVLLQPDLGTVLVAGGTMVAVLFAGGVKLGPLAITTGAGAVLATGLSMVEGYRRARLLAFLDPWDDPLNTGYQTIQSLVGIANGGVVGVGIGEGRSKWGFLPFAHTDFIYAIIAEEMGLLGALVVLSLFVMIAIVGVRIALRAPDRFGTLVALGIVVWLVLQAMVNIGAVIGVLPITGVPLPFVSFGGTSLLAGMAAVGMLLNIGRQGHA